MFIEVWDLNGSPIWVNTNHVTMIEQDYETRSELKEDNWFCIHVRTECNCDTVISVQLPDYALSAFGIEKVSHE